MLYTSPPRDKLHSKILFWIIIQIILFWLLFRTKATSSNAIYSTTDRGSNCRITDVAYKIPNLCDVQLLCCGVSFQILPEE